MKNKTDPSENAPEKPPRRFFGKVFGWLCVLAGVLAVLMRQVFTGKGAGSHVAFDGSEALVWGALMILLGLWMLRVQSRGSVSKRGKNNRSRPDSGR